MNLKIRSRHPSCGVLRKKVKIPFNAVYRHGSTSASRAPMEINSIESVENSASKLRMKRKFDEGKVKHLPWGLLSELNTPEKLKKNKIEFPLVIKHIFGSRGKGNHRIEKVEEFNQFLKGHTPSNYIVEPFFSGVREYRIHVTKDGPIYSLRKLLKDGTPKEKRWIRNDETCVWICEYQPSYDSSGNFLGFRDIENPLFDRPSNWKHITEECVKALAAVGLDIGACDVKCQSKKEKTPNFYIIEINSAPALGVITAEIYKKHLPLILKSKYKK